MLYAPHVFCLLGDPWMVWTQVIADLLVGMFYLLIPVALFVFIQHDKLPAPYIVATFICFILACGSTHFSAVLTMFVGGQAYIWHLVTTLATVVFSAASAVVLYVVLRMIRAAEANKQG